MVRATDLTESPDKRGDLHAPITRNPTVVRARPRRFDVRSWWRPRSRWPAASTKPAPSPNRRSRPSLKGRMRWALYVTLSPVWFDPGEFQGLTVHERVRFGPIWDYIWPSGVGPRVEEPALMLINPYPWSAPLEEVRLKRN